VAPGQEWTRIEHDTTVAGEDVYLPIPCQQCQDAPCVSVCPVKANTIRDDGIVMIDYDRCIGCRYCQIACPYDARHFNWEQFTGDNPSVPAWGQPEVARRPRGVVEKCSFCYQRIDRGLAAGLTPGVDQMATPACVVACPTKARIFGDLNDPDSNVSQVLRNHPAYRLREELGTDTRVYYLPADDLAKGVESS
jgi:Fe-S-cluster-containing dehydrogenase component